MKLRNYQQSAVDAVIECWKTCRSCVVILPTGCGKTVVFGEGPTDMLAACACGLNAVGRSSCLTGAAHLRAFIRRHRVRRVTIAADDDTPKQRPDGTTWRPGFEGARRLADELGLPTRIVFPFPGFKDLREWYAKGAMTDKAFAIATAGASWRGGIDPKEVLP